MKEIKVIGRKKKEKEMSEKWEIFTILEKSPIRGNPTERREESRESRVTFEGFIFAYKIKEKLKSK